MSKPLVLVKVPLHMAVMSLHPYIDGHDEEPMMEPMLVNG